MMMNKYFIRVTFTAMTLMLVTGIVCLSGCSPATEDEPISRKYTPGSEIINSNEVVAIVNDKEIKAGIIQEILEKRILEEQMEKGRPLATREIDQKRRMLIEQLIVEEVIRQAVESSTINVSKAEIDRRFELIGEEFGGMERFTNYLIQSGYSLEDFRNDARIDLTAAAIMRSQMGSHTTTVSMAQEYYVKQKDDFVFPEEASVSHILFKVGPETPAADQSNLVKRLLDIRKEILDGLDFGEAAELYSECPSAKLKGQIGTIRRGDDKISKLFADGAFATPLSNISGVVNTEFGSHLIYVTGRENVRTAEFELIKFAIMDGLDQIQEREMVQEWTQKLRAKANVIYKTKY